MPTIEMPSDPTSNAPAALLRGVVRTFGTGLREVRALDGVDLTVSPGEIVGLLGPNGAGKSTTVGLLLGLDRPTRGTVRVFGGSPRSRAVRYRVGAMLQSAQMPETLTVREHLEVHSSYYPRPLPLGQVLEAAGLRGLESRRFGKLSGGQKQRLLFALALCGDADLLVLDEPTVGLDIEAKQALWSGVRSAASAGKTVLLTTHDLEEADALSSRIVVLGDGRVVADDAPAEIKRSVRGRTIRCATSLASLDATSIGAWPGVVSARRDGRRLEIVADDTVGVVRALLDADPDLADLEVTAARLEDALLGLRGQNSRQNSGTTSKEIAA